LLGRKDNITIPYYCVCRIHIHIISRGGKFLHIA